MTEKEKKEVKLYDRWSKSEEKKVLEEYAEKQIEKVPEEYKEKIAKLREFGLGMKEKTTYEEVIEWLEMHEGKMMRSAIYKNGKYLKIEEITEEEREEVNLYARWRRCVERNILEKYNGRTIEEIPKKYLF